MFEGTKVPVRHPPSTGLVFGQDAGHGHMVPGSSSGHQMPGSGQGETRQGSKTQATGGAASTKHEEHVLQQQQQQPVHSMFLDPPSYSPISVARPLQPRDRLQAFRRTIEGAAGFAKAVTAVLEGLEEQEHQFAGVCFKGV